ncbi:MAG: acyl-CoA thioesterase [Bacilli bacterium]|nr:acyl-CoA thioesterase [Bacilli bacterium]MDD4076783.1 thioesterase family protein [Bacilli bacterium]
MRVITKIVPRYQETDKMGIIHHSVYPIWYECGRTDFCKALGMPYHEIEKRKVSQALIELNVKYHKSTHYGEELKLITKLKTVTGVRLVFEYELYNEKDELINTGFTTLVWLDENYKPTNITKHHPDIYNALLDSLE